MPIGIEWQYSITISTKETKTSPHLQGVYGVDPLRPLILGAEEEYVLPLQRARGAGSARPHAEDQVRRS